MRTHTPAWHTAAPLWSVALQDETRKRFRQPSILRFKTDAFMEELQGVLADRPNQLQNFVARPENWREEAAGWESAVSNAALKLYQPTQQRFYLIAASLVCRVPGLPDKRVASDERTTFVLRRLIDEQEYAWIPAVGWQSVAVCGQICEGEEQLPLFGMGFEQKGQPRRLLAGFVPVASRETFQATASLDPIVAAPDGDPLSEPRMVRFRTEVVTALSLLRDDMPDDAAEAREVFAFALFDLMQFLNVHLKDVRREISRSDGEPIEFDDEDREALHAFLVANLGKSLLQQVWRHEAEIEEGLVNYDDLFDDLSELKLSTGQINGVINDLDIPIPESEAAGTLVTLVEAALPQEDETEQPSTTPTPKLDPRAGSEYVVRCVYERPRCKGLPIVSEPTRAFQLASFFDSDAPARPIRITMPVDTSISGLRKYPKNVSFLLSDELRKQIERVQNIALSDLDSGDINAAQTIDLGMLCSLSIPIITICAMILLMIIVQLLNIVFWWLPFFKICIPLNLKAET